MYFKNRSDAGKQLAQQLQNYRFHHDVVVVALARGGVVPGFEISQSLDVPLDIIAPRKIGAPGNSELAVGAVTQSGEPVFDKQIMRSLGLTVDDVWKTVEQEQKEASRRREVYRADQEPLQFANKVVIIVDDGIATGATMRAAVTTVRYNNPEKIIIAVPICPPRVKAELEEEVNAVVALVTPEHFGGIGAFYKDFEQVDDVTVIAYMQDAKNP